MLPIWFARHELGEGRAYVQQTARPVAALLVALVVLVSSPLQAKSPLPHTKRFAEHIDEVFFRDGALDHAKLSDFRAEIALRRQEVVDVYVASYLARGEMPEAAEDRALNKKLVELYTILLGSPTELGMLGRLEAEADPVEAKVLAGKILEIEYALRVEGERPFTLRFVDYLTWMLLLPWTVDASTEAKRVDLEAVNLYDSESGLYFEEEDLVAQVRAGRDLSELGPPPDSSFWRDPGPIADVPVRETFYNGGDPLHAGLTSLAPGWEGELKKIRTTQTKPKLEVKVGSGSSRRDFKLKLGAEVFSEPTINALLATLGFNVDVTHHVKNFKLYLGDNDLGELQTRWRAYFEDRRNHNRFEFDEYFDLGEDEGGPYLVVREGVFEERRKELLRVGPWPFGDNGNEGLREVRGLGIFSIWVGNTDFKEAENNKLILRRLPIESGQAAASEGATYVGYHVHHDLGHALGRVVPEQLNAFPWELSKRTLTGRIRFNYHSVQPNSLRKRITYADARWMVRLIAQLTREQIESAVALGGWPDSAGRLLVEKLIHRRNGLVEIFDLVGSDSPSGAIELLRVDRKLTTEDGAVVAGELVTGEFTGSTKEFANYWEELLGPVWDVIAMRVVAIVQRSVGEVFAIVLDPDTVGIPAGLVSEILVNVRRQVYPNPDPTSADDYYLVNDDVKIGLRMGGGFVARGEVTFYRSYQLIQPAGTQQAGRLLDRTILNFLLPYQMARGELPETYVLVRRNYVDGRLRIITDDLSGGSAPVGVQATFSTAQESRNVITRKNGSLVLLRDRSRFAEEGYGAFVKLFVIRIPVMGHVASSGLLEGDLFSMPVQEIDSSPERRAAVDRAIERGEFSDLEEIVEPTPIRTRYEDRSYRVRLLSLFMHSERSRADDVIVGEEESGGPVERFYQYGAGGSRFWVFLDFGEAHHFQVTAVAPLDDNSEFVEVPVIVSRYRSMDLSTRSEELSKGEIGFINGLVGKHASNENPPLINFTPEEHSTNDRWGFITSSVKVGYSAEAVRRLLELESDAYWEVVSEALDVRRDRIELYRLWLDERGRELRIRRTKIPPDIRRFVSHAKRVRGLLHDARKQDRARDKVRRIVDALVECSVRNEHGFDPRLLMAIHELVGLEHVSIDAIITQPPWIEKRLLGGVDLAVHTHAKPFRLLRRRLDFHPSSSPGYYKMLERFPH